MSGKAKPKISKDDHERLSRIFDKLDRNNDGTISVDELKAAFGSHLSDTEVEGRAQSIINSSDKNTDSIMNFEEFLEFVQSRETHLKLAFKQMDRNNDNKIDATEIQMTMADLGVKIGIKEAENLLKRMDKDNSLNISYDEWRNYLLFATTKDIKDIIQLWRKSSFIDIGENMTIPDDFSSEEKMTGVAWKTLVSGGVAGCVSRTATAPLDRLKVTMQAHGDKAASRGLISAIKYMIHEGGYGSLWRGNGVNCIKIAPESAIKFLAYETYKKEISKLTGNDHVSLLEKFVAGAMAGATAQTIIYPMEVLKTRMCLRQSGQYSSIVDCARKVYAHEGAAVFFRGYVPNIIGILPYAGIDLCLFETFKQMYTSRHPCDSSEGPSAPPVYVSLTAGAVSSVCGQIATYPLALVRTKLQAMSKSDAAESNMMTTFKKTVRHEGLTGLYRGMGPNMLKVIPAVSISYAVFDQMRAVFNIH